MGSKRNYLLGSSSSWLYHHCRALLSTVGSSCSKTLGEAGQNLFLHDNARPRTLKSRRVKNYRSSDGLQLHIYRILQIWLQLTTTCSILWLIIYARKNSTTRTTSKQTSTISLTKNPRTFTNTGSFRCQSVGNTSQILMEHTNKSKKKFE